MPRYFFNIVHGRMFVPDPEGDILPTDEEACSHARAVAREVLSDPSHYSRGIERWAFKITDRRAQQVGVVSFAHVKTKMGNL